MIPFPYIWIALTILCPLAGAVWMWWLHDPHLVRRYSLLICGATLASSLLASMAFVWAPMLGVGPAAEPLAGFFGAEAFVVDAVNAPLLPLASLLYLLTALSTLRTKWRRFSFSRMLASEAVLLATLSCKQPWVLVALLAVGVIPPWIELSERRQATRVFTLHMTLFVALLIAGQALIGLNPSSTPMTVLGTLLLIAAVLVRSGCVPVHCWMTDLFERATFGTSLLFVTPMVGAYGALRLVLPVAPEGVLHVLSVFSLVTAIYAAAMALVQREARRFFCYLFLSQSSLVLVGLGTGAALGLTAALCVWLSVGLSLAGFGLTLRSIESRTGRLSLEEFHGMYEHAPRLAGLFLLTGLASIGFPGTIGFVGVEMLVDGASLTHPLLGVAIVVGSALNGLAVLYAFFRVFTGTRRTVSVDLRSRLPEQVAVLIFTALIVGGGLYPQPGVMSQYRAATEIVEQRQGSGAAPPADQARQDAAKPLSAEFLSSPAEPHRRAKSARPGT